MTEKEWVRLGGKDGVCLRALISARGAKMDEKVDADFLSMLAEEGYDSDAVRLISNQLEELRRFGLVKETANGFRWIK